MEEQPLRFMGLVRGPSFCASMLHTRSACPRPHPPHPTSTHTPKEEEKKEDEKTRGHPHLPPSPPPPPPPPTHTRLPSFPPDLTHHTHTNTTHRFNPQPNPQPPIQAKPNMADKAGDEGVPPPVAAGEGAPAAPAVVEGGKKRSPNRLIVDEATNDDNR